MTSRRPSVIVSSNFPNNNSKCSFLLVPRCLREISIMRLKFYLCDLVGALILTPQPRETARRKIKAVCRNLEQLIITIVPPAFANEITHHFSSALNWYLCNFLCEHSPSPGNSYDSWYDEVTQNILNAIFHPRASLIRCTDTIYYKRNGWRLRILNDKLLYKLSNLKVLRLEETEVNSDILLECFKVIPHLEEFAYYWCTDEELAILSETCYKLKNLSLRESRYITNVSVHSLLKFEKLEELDIFLTSLTEEGLEQLYQELGPSRKITKLGISFIITQFSPTHLERFAVTFQNLTSLEVFLTKDCNLTPLVALKKLKHFSIGIKDIFGRRPFFFDSLKEFFQNVGHQISSLALFNVVSTDLNFIQMHFPILKKLTLYYISCRYINFSMDMPVFPTIQELDLCLPEEEMVTKVVAGCTKLKCLTVLRTNVRFKILSQCLQKGVPLEEVRDEKGNCLLKSDGGYNLSWYNENSREFDTAWMSDQNLKAFLKEEEEICHW